MSAQETSKKPVQASWRQAFDFVKDYFFHSDEKLIAWLFLIGITLCVVGGVAIMALLSWQFSAFWAALTAKTLAPFLICMAQVCGLIGAFVGTFVLRYFLMGKLTILWRSWLTEKTLKKLFGDTNYLSLKRLSKTDNNAQRIQEDIKAVVDLTLNLGFDLLKSVLSLGTFLGSLWVVGGPLALSLFGLNIVIPGYLVWTALVIAIAASITTYYIARSLADTKKKEESSEADLRQNLELINDDAENIAQEHAEEYYRQSLDKKVQDINENANQKLNVQSRLTTFQNFYVQLAQLLPTVLAAPLYFSGLIDIGQLMQIGMSFGEVNASFSWFVLFYEPLVSYRTKVGRITELQRAFEKDGLVSNSQAIVRKTNNSTNLMIQGLNIMPPQPSKTPYIMRNLNLNLTAGEHILLKGPSGLGKSTLFKAISGTWKYGDGSITIPSGKSMYFLPQRPTLPHDTLMAVLAYPQPVNTYTEEQYIKVLKAVKGMDDFLDKLHERRNWSKELSGGQQQRISFARVLLKKPDWLFLDEATSALDEESEQHVYSITKGLENTTIVSIAHRQTVERHHSRVVYFSANDKREIDVREQPRMAI